jgi:hypothetical protein
MALLVGFSGSRHGMTQKQISVVRHLLNDWRVIGVDRIFRHGCCVGADSQADGIAREFLYKVAAHPGPSNDANDCYDAMKALGVKFWEENPRKNYLERNVDIVMKSNILIATPNKMTFSLQGRGGTLYTTRVAVERGRKVYLVLADGTIHSYYERKYLGIVIPGEDVNANQHHTRS